METTPTRENPCSFALIPPNVKNPTPLFCHMPMKINRLNEKCSNIPLYLKDLRGLCFLLLGVSKGLMHRTAAAR